MFKNLIFRLKQIQIITLIWITTLILISLIFLLTGLNIVGLFLSMIFIITFHIILATIISKIAKIESNKIILFKLINIIIGDIQSILLISFISVFKSFIKSPSISALFILLMILTIIIAIFLLTVSLLSWLWKKEMPELNFKKECFLIQIKTLAIMLIFFQILFLLN